MENIFTTHSAEETRVLGKKIAQELAPETLLCLRGDLGSGKTTFTQGLLEGLGAARPYVSPTFVIMKEYALPKATTTGIKRVYHCDAYRVHEKDFETLGFAEWCADPEGLVILEWPERVKNIISPKAMCISLIAKSEIDREISIENTQKPSFITEKTFFI